MIPKVVTDNISEFKFYASRPKVMGRMWGGRAVSVVKSVKVELQLWCHGEEEETEERLKKHLTIKFVNGQDAYWNCLWDHKQLWIHPTGWFEDQSLRKHIPNANPNFGSRMLPEEKLKKLGFTRLI